MTLATFVMTHVLSLLCVVPLIAAGAVSALPRDDAGDISRVTVGSMLGVFALSLLLCSGDYTSGTLQFSERAPWVSAYGISYSVGVDGLSLWLILLTTLIMPIAAHASFPHIETQLKLYAIALLTLESALIGAFIAMDLFLFYIFWELMLFPMLLIIGIWGGPQRIYAAFKFFMYTMLGGVLMLVAIMYLVQQYKLQTGVYSFELSDLKQLLLPVQTQQWLFLAFALAFAIKVPMFPVHSWLPDAHVQAPTGGSVILAAVMLKLGTYGFLRLAMPLFPAGSQYVSGLIAALALIGIIYGALCAWSQSDVKKLVAYSSISHLGFVMLGIYSLSVHGVTGSVLQMVNHGISTGALFLLVGVIYERRHTRQLGDFGGLAMVMPMYAAVFVMVAMSSAGLPATNGFVGEFMILTGVFMSDALGMNGPVTAVGAATGVILAAVYMLHAVLKMFWGPLDKKENRSLKDLSLRECSVLAPLVVLIFYIGLCPAQLLGGVQPTVEQFVAEYVAKLEASEREPGVRRLLTGDLGLPDGLVPERSDELDAPEDLDAAECADTPLITMQERP